MAARSRRSRAMAASACSAPAQTVVAPSPGPIVAVCLDPPPLVQAAWWASPASRSAPLAVVSPAGRVLAVCPEARAAGVRAGHTLAQARLRCPRVRPVAPPDAVAHALWHSALAALATVSPVVEDADAARGIAYVDAHGLERLWGDGAAVARRCLSALTGADIAARAGVGPCRTVALALARRMDARGPRVLEGSPARDFLRRLPIDEPALGLPDAVTEQLREMGITTAGVLASLPSAGLALRFGATAVAARSRASGQPEPPLRPWSPPPAIWVETTVEGGIVEAGQAQALLARLVADLAARLRGRAACTLTLRLRCETGARCLRTSRHDRPLHDAATLTRAVAALWQGIAVPAPVEEVALGATDLRLPVVEQAGLWSADGSAGHQQRRERLAQALAVHARRYGAESLQRLRPDPQAIDGWRWEGYGP